MRIKLCHGIKTKIYLLVLWIFENIMKDVANSSLLNVSEDLRYAVFLYIHVYHPADTVHFVNFTILFPLNSHQSGKFNL